MRFRPQSVDELDPNIRWGVEMRLRLIEEVVTGHHVSWFGAPGKDEAMKRIMQALARGDRKAEEEAAEDYMRAELMEWWRIFPEQQLLKDLYGRAARRSERRGSRDSRRRPDHKEGLRVAKAMLADIPDVGGLDREWESAAVSAVLAAPPPSGVFSPGMLPEYIKRSEESRVYFDAVERIEEEAKSRHEDIPRPHWPQDVRRRRKRPARKRLRRGRQPNPAKLRRDIQIQFTIEVLKRVGIRPQSTYVSGCRIVSEALGMRVDTVERIWNERPWNRSFVPEMQKQSKAIAERTGPFHTTEI